MFKVLSEVQETVVDNDTNTLPIYCPKDSCHCTIFRAKAAKKYTNSTLIVPPLEAQGEPSPSPFYWRVNDMMAFENVAFSKAVASGERYLACADCEIGPIGAEITVDGSKAFVICADRVSYKQ